MDAKVVDASAAAAFVFREREGIEIAGRLRGARLVAPTLLRFEMASVCLKKMRRDPTSRRALLNAFEVFERMQIARIDVDHSAVIELANTAGLSSYHASYLWLAHWLDAELVTLDTQLEAAAKAPRRT
jgi:predicted nucleic acid-binding protein